MAFNQKTFEDNLRNFVAKGSLMQSKYVHPQSNVGPKTEDCFASVVHVHEHENGWPAYGMVSGDTSGGDPTVIQIVYTPVIATYSIQWYRKQAAARAQRFASWSKADYGILAAAHYGFSIQKPLKAKRIDMQVTEGWEERWSMDLILGYWQDNEYDVGYIDTVPITTLTRDQRETLTVQEQET